MSITSLAFKSSRSDLHNFWQATDITRHNGVSVECSLYWPGRVLMWGSVGMTLVTGLLLWVIYLQSQLQLAVVASASSSGNKNVDGLVFWDRQREEDGGTNHSNGNDDNGLGMYSEQEADNLHDVEMMEYPQEEWTSA
jgi:hypothetical protein